MCRGRLTESGDEYYEARSELLSMKRECREEEDEARRRGEDVDRLGKDRNEWKEYYDEVTAWGDEENEHAHDSKSEGSVVSGSVPDPFRCKISRKKADKIIVPNWPKVHELEV